MSVKINSLFKRSGMSNFRIVFSITAVFCFYWFLIGKIQLCVFRLFTGLPCPGCGLTHAGLALLKGDWRASLQYHPLLLPILFVLVTTIVPKWRITNKYFLWGLFSLLMILYFVRLVLYFPDGPLPMIYDHASLAGKLLSLTGIIR